MLYSVVLSQSCYNFLRGLLQLFTFAHFLRQNPWIRLNSSVLSLSITAGLISLWPNQVACLHEITEVWFQVEGLERVYADYVATFPLSFLFLLTGSWTTNWNILYLGEDVVPTSFLCLLRLLNSPFAKIFIDFLMNKPLTNRPRPHRIRHRKIRRRRPGRKPNSFQRLRDDYNSW